MYLGIPNQHHDNVYNLKNRQNCSSSAMPQVNVHNLPNAQKVPNGAGYAKSDSTTCLTTPQRCWGPLGRSEDSGPAVFLGPDFWRIGVNGSLAQVTASARIAQTGSNVTRWFYLLYCARDARDQC